MPTKSLQATYAANSICFGCGPANPEGLQINSEVEGDQVVCTWHPKPYHHAFPGVLNGGIICSILDCHCNWAAAYYLMQAQKNDEVPSTVTAEFSVKFLRPTPMDYPLRLIARLEKLEDNRATIHGELIADNQVCATCIGKFVAVSEGHPAFHRWEQ